MAGAADVAAAASGEGRPLISAGRDQSADQSGSEASVREAQPLATTQAASSPWSLGSKVLVSLAVLAVFLGGVYVGPMAKPTLQAILAAVQEKHQDRSSDVHVSDTSAQHLRPATTTKTTTTTTTTTTTATTTAISTTPAGPTHAPPVAPYTCQSDLYLGPVQKEFNKGVALDDTTFQTCPSLITVEWPHAKEKMTSIRLFKAWWGRWGGDEERKAAWSQIREFVWKNDAKVLFGTQITCNETDDDVDWGYTWEFMQYIGRPYAMGLAIGNEIELLWSKKDIEQDCLDRIWQKGYFSRKVQERTNALATIPAFSDLTITSVMGGYVLAGQPFVDSKQAGVASFFRWAVSVYGRRWAFTWNIYPYFDPHIQLDAGGFGTCNDAMQHAINFAPGCMLPSQLAELRRRTAAITGRKDDITWLGETGWSYPQASTLDTVMAGCKEFSTQEAMSLYYQNFLDWDLSLGADVRPIDHAFYFTFRDSVNFELHENFGLMSSCNSFHCKLQTEKDRLLLL
mmetsp:Transcript_59604/g.107203  ORF Transcript_59604/g.107203 Transcript_59604/m.107203 type:complete len:512 (+) Transcript_59604:184-1719(+)